MNLLTRLIWKTTRTFMVLPPFDENNTPVCHRYQTNRFTGWERQQQFIGGEWLTIWDERRDGE